MSLIALSQEDLELGVPVPWAVYDQDKNLLLPKGGVITSLDQLLTLLGSNPCRELTWDDDMGDAAVVADPFPLPASPPAGAETRVEITPPSKSDGAQQGAFPFDAMKLRVGDRLQLQPPHQLSTERYIVRLIGYLNNVSLLVSAPFEGGLRLGLKEGEKVVVRVFAAQNAFGFNSTVDKICKYPFDYLHLSFPREVQGMVIRKSPRVRTRIIAAVANTHHPDVENTSGLIANISATGAMLDGRRSLGNKGDMLRLAFRINLHKIDAYLSITAAIRAIFADEAIDAKGDPLIHHGIEFVDLAPNDSVILQSLIYQQMIEQPHTLA